VSESITAESLCLAFQEECKIPQKTIEPKLDDTQCSFGRGRKNTEQISTLQQIFEKSWKHAKD